MQDGTTETNHGVIDYLVVTGTDWWDSLEPAVRDQLGTIIAEVTATRNSESFAVNEEAKKAVLEAGGEVRELTPAQRAEWVETMKPVWDQFMGDVGEENVAAAQSINEMN